MYGILQKITKEQNNEFILSFTIAYEPLALLLHSIIQFIVKNCDVLQTKHTPY